MIRTRTVEQVKHYGCVFPPMLLAQHYCVGQGLEMGAGAFNPFDLPGALNVAPRHDFAFWQQVQLRFCGAYAEVDVWAKAHALPFPDQSQDYVLASHVLEHLVNPLAALVEWQRVLKPGGMVFLIVPKQETLPADQARPITPLSTLIEVYEQGQTDETLFPDEQRWGHYYVYSLASLRALVGWLQARLGLVWEILYTEDTDSKIGSGHTLVARVASVTRS